MGSQACSLPSTKGTSLGQVHAGQEEIPDPTPRLRVRKVTEPILYTGLGLTLGLTHQSRAPCLAPMSLPSRLRDSQCLTGGSGKQ